MKHRLFSHAEEKKIMRFTCLKAAVKAPKYATTPDDTNTSPMRFVNLIPSCLATSVHLKKVGGTHKQVTTRKYITHLCCAPKVGPH